MSPAAFILGAGGHVGLAVANKLKQEGYKVAVGARNPLQKEGLVPITVDVSDTDSVTKAFAEVKEKLGAAPNVVVFNGSSIRSTPPPKKIIFTCYRPRLQLPPLLYPKYQATRLRSNYPPSKLQQTSRSGCTLPSNRPSLGSDLYRRTVWFPRLSSLRGTGSLSSLATRRGRTSSVWDYKRSMERTSLRSSTPLTRKRDSGKVFSSSGSQAPV